MTHANQLQPLPTLRPGDSNMESLIEAAIQGHASTREAMRWLVRQLVSATQPAEVTDVMIDAIAAQHTWSVDYPTRFVTDTRAVVRAILALRPVQSTFCEYCGGNDEEPVDHCMDCTRPVLIPMNQDEVIAAIKSANISSSTTFWSIFEAGIRAAEAHHHRITAQSTKEQA